MMNNMVGCFIRIVVVGLCSLVRVGFGMWVCCFIVVVCWFVYYFSDFLFYSVF